MAFTLTVVSGGLAINDSPLPAAILILAALGYLVVAQILATLVRTIADLSDDLALDSDIIASQHEVIAILRDARP